MESWDRTATGGAEREARRYQRGPNGVCRTGNEKNGGTG